MTTWRFAARLALREVRRRRGRTALVVLLVLVPVLGMTVASVLIRTVGADGWFARVYPEDVDLSVPAGDGRRDEIDALVPADASAWTVRSVHAPLELGDGTVTKGVEIHELGEEGQLPRRVVDTAGALPGPGQIWLSQRLLDELDTKVGDALTLRHPAGTWQVAGGGRAADWLDGRMLIFDRLPDDTFSEHVIDESLLIDLPAGIDRSAAAAIADDVLEIAGGSSRYGDADTSPSGESLAWGWVGGTIALGATGIIVAAAFATSARRQLVTIGLLSANGASERVLRRSLALQGTWTALVGSLLGVALGLAALGPARPLLENLQDYVLPAYRISVADLAVIVATGTLVGTLAALLPARSAATVPVMAALAGRRPLGLVPRRLVPIGGGAFALGVVLLTAAASSGDGSGGAAVAVIGGLFVLAGVCCCSPLATDAMSRLSARVGRAWRFAGRSLGRTRTRSAAVVTAIAVAAAVSAAGSAAALSAIDDAPHAGLDDVVGVFPVRSDLGAIEPGPVEPVDAGEPDIFGDPGPGLAPDPVVEPGSLDGEPWPDLPFPGDLKERLLEAVDGAVWVPRRIVQLSANSRGSPTPDRPGLETGVVIADEQVMDVYRLSAAERERLEEIGALALRRPRHTTESETVTIPTDAGDVRLPYGARDPDRAKYHLTSLSVGIGPFGAMWVDDLFLMTPEAAARAGVVVVDNGGWLVAPDAISAEEQRRVEDAVFGGSFGLADAYRDVELAAGAGEWAVWSRDVTPVSVELVQAVILGVALLAVLLVVAIGLSLSATESRDERDVLVAVGARPATMRSMAGAKAVVMSLTGAVLGVPAGLIPVYFATWADDLPFEVPWLAVGGLVVAIPVLAGIVATAASAVAHSVRPVTMSTLAVD